ncbi:MAG: 30S ribosomal protein S6 [Alphaproteobacteria bacterium GM7ARS4]|nr:30S ribosomal protein S6 [Alphaproteobacteria bacterium GM7ARS4]
MLYESIFILRQDLTTRAVEDVVKKYVKVLTKKGAKIKNQESWGLVPLAYPMRKNKSGHFHLFHIEGEPRAVQEMEKAMRLDEDIIRCLTLSVKKHITLPSPMKAFLDAQSHREREREREAS